MIRGLDSSDNRPTPDVLAQAWAAGVRVWGGYLVSASDADVLAARARNEGMLGLAAPWTLEEFRTVQASGMRALGFCSGNDDAAAVGEKARENAILACLDDESGIRPTTGGWQQAWVDAAGSGHYGGFAVPAVAARFEILAYYPGSDPGAAWPPTVARPSVPVGWQWQGTHQEFGVSVDSLWLDDWFARGARKMMVSCARPDGGRDWYTLVGDHLEHTVTDFGSQIVFRDTLPGSWSALIQAGYRDKMAFVQGLGSDVGASAFEVSNPGPGWVLTAKP